MKHRTTFRRSDGIWLPEHVRMAIRKALGDHSRTPIKDAKAATLRSIKQQFPALPMRDAEIKAAIDRVSQEMLEG